MHMNPPDARSPAMTALAPALKVLLQQWLPQDAGGTMIAQAETAQLLTLPHAHGYAMMHFARKEVRLWSSGSTHD